VSVTLGVPEVSHYGAPVSAALGRTVRIEWPGLPGIEVQVRPRHADHQDAADALAASIAETVTRTAARVASCEAAVEAMRGERDAARARAEAARARVEILTGERRRFIGPAVVRPDRAGDWSGPVWLLDPSKNWDGFGFHFDSLSALWADMPDLRPTSAGADALGPLMLVASQPVRS
jgi:hypothetical protein